MSSNDIARHTILMNSSSLSEGPLNKAQGEVQHSDKGKGKMVDAMILVKRKSASDAPTNEPTILVDEDGEMVMARAEAVASIYLAGDNAFTLLVEDQASHPVK